MGVKRASRMWCQCCCRAEGRRGRWGGLEWGRHFHKSRCHFLWAYGVTERWILNEYGIMVEWYWHGRETCPIFMPSGTNPTYTGMVTKCLSRGTVRMRMKKEKLVSECWGGAALCWVTGLVYLHLTGFTFCGTYLYSCGGGAMSVELYHVTGSFYLPWLINEFGVVVEW
jgi:hypothetical protein